MSIPGTSLTPMNFTNEAQADLASLSSLLKQKKYDAFIRAENAYYHNHIRVSEDRAHQQRHYVELNRVVAPYGDLLKDLLNKKTRLCRSDKKTIVFFLPNIDNDFAHISMLVDLVSKLSYTNKYQLVVAGFARSKKRIASRLVHQMYKSGKIEIYPLIERHEDLVNFLDWSKSNSKTLLVSYSQPRLLTPLIRALGSKKVLWHVTKFDLSVFDELRFGMRGIGNQFQEHADATKWYTIPGSLPEEYQFSYKQRSDSKIKIISVNREQKIRQGEFLETIAITLKETRNAHFFWTGRQWDKEVVARFAAAGASGHHTYIGWIDHKEALPSYDIFADTFGLSGIIAAAAFAAGMPIVMMRGASSWLERAEKEIIEGQRSEDYVHLKKIKGCLADSVEDYRDKLARVIEEVRSKSYRSDWQRSVAKKYFLNFECQARSLNQAIDEIFQECTIA